MKGKYWLIIILIFAFFIRVYGMGEPPLWVDESISSIASSNIVEKGVPELDSGNHYGRAYLFHYTQAFFFWLFGEGDFTARLPSLIFGLLTIVLAYYMGREYSKYGGVVAALFMSVFYLEVFFSRQARFYQLVQLMFFLSIYLLYKSKDRRWCLYASLVSFFIALNTHLISLVLAPFFILYILYYQLYNKEKYLGILPAIPLVNRFFRVFDLTSTSSGGGGSGGSMVGNYVNNYLSYANNIYYMIIFFIPGLVWSFFRKRRLTLLVIIPSLIALLGIVFTVKFFAFRYVYFFIFPLVLYSSLLFSYLYEKYGWMIGVSIALVLIIPSNVFFPFTFATVLEPTTQGFYPSSAPYSDYEGVELGNETLVSYFSANVEWYIRKPDYVIPFSMSGIGRDSISHDGTGVYSGAPILEEVPSRPYYLTANDFSISKLKGDQQEFFNNLTSNCSVSHSGEGYRIFHCS